MPSVLEVYEAELAARGYQSDPAQLRGVLALDRCAQEWSQYKEQRSNAFKKLINRPPIPRGVYMYGGVGRGKSFLMDCFFQAVPVVRKTGGLADTVSGPEWAAAAGLLLWGLKGQSKVKKRPRKGLAKVADSFKQWFAWS